MLNHLQLQEVNSLVFFAFTILSMQRIETAMMQIFSSAVTSTNFTSSLRKII